MLDLISQNPDLLGLLFLCVAFCIYSYLPPEKWMEQSVVRTSQLRPPALGTQQIRSTTKDHPWKVLSLDKGHSGGRQFKGLVTPYALRTSFCSFLSCTILILSQGIAHLQWCTKPCCVPLARGLLKTTPTICPSNPSWPLVKWNCVRILWFDQPCLFFFFSHEKDAKHCSVMWNIYFA